MPRRHHARSDGAWLLPCPRARAGPLRRACGCGGGLTSCSFGSKTVRARCPGPLEIGAGPPAYGAVPQRPSCVRLSGEGAFRQGTCRFRSATRSGCGCGSSGTLRSAERSLRHGARPCSRPGWRWTPSGESGTQSSARCCSTSRLHPPAPPPWCERGLAVVNRGRVQYSRDTGRGNSRGGGGLDARVGGSPRHFTQPRKSACMLTARSACRCMEIASRRRWHPAETGRSGAGQRHSARFSAAEPFGRSDAGGWTLLASCGTRQRCV